jgi:uridine kinase
LGSAARVEQRFHNRYLPSQQHYFDAVCPTDLADIIVHNDEPQQPAWEAREEPPAPADDSAPRLTS